jgi:hypothetical protein
MMENKLLINSFSFPCTRSQVNVIEPYMVTRDRNLVVNVCYAVILGIILCAVLFLAVFLFFSPTL